MVTAEGIVRSLAPAFDGLGDPLLVLAAARRPPGLHVHFANAALLRRTGLRRDAVAGRPFEALLAPRTRSACAYQVDSAMARAEPFAAGLELAAPGGGVIRFRFTPVSDGAGGTACWVASATADATAADPDAAAIEHTYRHLVENQPGLICRFLPDTTLTFVNAAFATFFRVGVRDLIGRPFLALVAPCERRAVLDRLAEITPTAPTRQFEQRFESDGGATRWHLWDTLGFFDRSRRPVLFQAVATDITERKVAEQRLRDSEKRIRDITDALPSRISYIDRERIYRFANKAYERDTGVSCEAIVGRRVSDFLGAAVYADIAPHIDAVLTGRRVRYEYLLTGPGGEAHKDITYVPDIDASGAVRGFYTLVHDVTERKRAEDALFAEKERAQVTLHSIGDAVITTDAAGLIDYVNPVAESLTGWTASAAVGKAAHVVFRIIDEQTRAAAANPIARCLAEGRVVVPSRPIALVARNRREIATEATAAPIRGRSGHVLGSVLVFRDVTEERRRARQLAHDAAHDALTGLVNRREFERRIERAIASARRYGLQHALCFIDLDRFKGVNDAAGHAAGDAVLAQMRGLLAGKFRERDTLARLGGDEFGLLLDACAPEEAIRIAEIIVAAIRDHRFAWRDRSFQIGASVGIVPIDGAAGSGEELLARADVACYAAKQQGGGRVLMQRGSGSGEPPEGGEVVLATHLQQAVEQRRFELFCQPILPLNGGGRPAVFWEVLLRLRGEDGTLTTPDAFVPAAERYGLMSGVDRWVIETAFGFFAEHLRARRGIGLAINLSANSMTDEKVVDFIRTQLARFAVPPERICFEIPETLAVRHLASAAMLTRAIRALGLKLALDDFGAGLSSFTHLKALPANVLKIDGSFVRDLAHSKVDAAVVSAAQAVGRSMGIETVGEFAHSEVVVRRLRELGVDHAQGYAVGRPQPLGALAFEAAACAG